MQNERGTKALIVGLLRQRQGRIGELYDPKAGAYTSPAVQIATLIGKPLAEVEECLSEKSRFWRKEEGGRVTEVGLGRSKPPKKAGKVTIRRIEPTAPAEQEKTVLNRESIAQGINLVLAYARSEAAACDGSCKDHASRGSHGLIAQNSLSSLVGELKAGLTSSQTQRIAADMAKLGLVVSDRVGNGRFKHYIILDTSEVTVEMLQPPIQPVTYVKAPEVKKELAPVAQIVQVISGLEAQLATANQELSAAARRNTQLERQNTKLENRVTEQQVRIRDLEAQIRRLEAEIAKLRPLAEMASELNTVLRRHS